MANRLGVIDGLAPSMAEELLLDSSVEEVRLSPGTGKGSWRWLDESTTAPVFTCDEGGYNSFCHESHKNNKEVEKIMMSTSFFVSIAYLVRLIGFDTIFE